MKTIKLSEATGSLEDYARHLNGELVVVTQRNKPIAALMPLNDADLESLRVGSSPVFQAIVRDARKRLDAGEGIPAEEVHRQLGLPPYKQGRRKKASRRTRMR